MKYIVKTNKGYISYRSHTEWAFTNIRDNAKRVDVSTARKWVEALNKIGIEACKRSWLE